ncbi:MAG TPA: helix-turn-helix transcriptional regulator [Candidatus Saccharimonadia bacterium]
MDWKDVKQGLLEDEELRKAYEKVDLSHSIGKMIIDARIAKQMTQQKLAQLVGTQQPSIARIERGSYLPSLSFLQKIAEAFNTQLLPPRLEFLEKNKPAFSTTTSTYFHSEPNREREFDRFNASWQGGHSSTNSRTFSIKELVQHGR